MKLNINGKDVTVEVEGSMPLLWVLRDELNLTGTKYGCGISACGACSVHVDGTAVRSCVTPVSTLEGKSITTIEGVAKDGQLSAVQRAWIIQQVPQCGFCQSGMIMAVESMLDKNPEPTDEDIDKTITNICRCGTYQRVKEAIALAVEYRKGAETNLS
ncbi:MAG: (2Fe-2S)-binding protein [Bacteroidota bacterium]